MNYYPRNNGFQQRQNGGYGGQRQQGNFDMKGRAWQNNSANPKAPQFSGLITVQGVEYQISVWFGHDPNKGDILNFKLQPKQDQRRQEFQQGNSYNGYAPQNRGSYSPSGGNQYGQNSLNNSRQYSQGGPQNGGYAPQPQQQHYAPPQNAAPNGNNALHPMDDAPLPHGPEDYGADPFA